MVMAMLSSPVFAADEAALARGEAALKRKGYAEAIAVFDEILQKNPSNAAAYVGRGRAHDAQDDLAQGIADYTEALKLEPRAKTALWWRHSDYAEQGDFPRAIADLDELIKIEPTSAANYRARAQIRAHLKQFTAALEDMNQAVRAEGRATENYDARGDIYLHAGAFQEAIDDYSAAISLNRTNAGYFQERAQAFVYSGRYREAVDDLRESLRLKSSDWNLNDMAWLLATCPDETLLDGPKAVELATKACELSAWKDSGILDTLAAACARAGDFENAVRWQSKAIECAKDEHAMEGLQARKAAYQRKEAFTEPLADKARVEWSLKRSACFNTVWTTVNENYYDMTFGGMDWKVVREKYRARLWEAADNRLLRRLLQDMLDELHRTHFAIVPREMSVLQPEERGRIGYTGAEVASVEEAITVVRVKPGSPAGKAGLKPGDVVRRVDAVVLSEMAVTLSESVPSARKRMLYLRSFVNWRLAAPVGQEVSLQLEDTAGVLREVKVVACPFEGLWSEPMGFAPSDPIECEVRRGPEGVVCLRFNVFALPVMTEFKRCVRSLQPGEGLIIDLRGNPGGLTLMAPGIYGRLSTTEVSLGTMHRRYGTEEFTAYPQRGAFLGPVAVLVDSASASTSEILTAGLQESGRARVFGELTAGAALPSLFRQLPTGDMLQYAVADIKTPHGVLIEGHGVVPDEPVAVRRADCIAGRDPVLEAATRWIASQRANATKEVVAK